MRNTLSNLNAIILVVISFIFNSYLLALYFGFAYSLVHFFIGHGLPSQYSNTFFIELSFSIMTILLVIGTFNLIPPLSRCITGSRKPLLDEENRIKDLLSEVASGLGYTAVVEILISEKDSANVSAYGANTIIVGEDLLDNFTSEEIKAVLVHEISHLKNKDGLIVLAMFWINIPIELVMWLYHLYAKLSLKISKDFSQKGNLFSVLTLIPLIIFSPIIALNFIGKIVLRITFSLVMRIFEYNADIFTAKNGFRDGLISFLNKQRMFEDDNIPDFFATHPSSIKRIARLEKY